MEGGNAPSPLKVYLSLHPRKNFITIFLQWVFKEKLENFQFCEILLIQSLYTFPNLFSLTDIFPNFLFQVSQFSHFNPQKFT